MSPKRFTVLLVLLILFASAAAAAVLTLARRPPRPARAAGLSVAKLPMGFGDPARCSDLAKQYAAAIDGANHCETDDECAVELRGEIWFGLEGCARYRSSKSSFAPADALAKQWAASGCANDYELCSHVPRVMCRAGRCVERPPDPLPDTWVRFDVARVFSFYLPPDMKKVEVRGEDSLVRRWESEGLTLSVDYGGYANPLDFGDDPRFRVLDERRTEIAGWKAKTVLLQQVTSQEWPFAAGVHFPAVPECSSPSCAFYGADMRLTVIADCKERAGCESALMALRSIVFW